MQHAFFALSYPCENLLSVGELTHVRTVTYVTRLLLHGITAHDETHCKNDCMVPKDLWKCALKSECLGSECHRVLILWSKCD